MKAILLSVAFLAIAVRIMGQIPYNVIATNTDKDLIPEGIAINPVDKTIYVSSVALKKIVAIDQTGMCRDFVKTNQDEFLEGLGMQVDEKKQWLWVVSNQRNDKWYASRIHAFDLKTGLVQQQYMIKDTAQHLFNDLVIHRNNKLYITDTFASSVYEVDPINEKLKLLVQDPMLTRANGITHNAQGTLFVATRNGLVQLDHQSKKLTPLTYGNAKTAFWMDGIVYWNNSIIGVADAGIMQYNLNKGNDQIIGESVIDKANKLFHDPTTAAILSDKLYLLANSYLSVYNENHESAKGIEDKLGSVVILVYDLRH